MSETWLTNDICDAELMYNDYVIFRGDREGRYRGGAGLYVRNDLYPKIVTNYSNGVVDFVMIKVRKLKSLVIAIYRPPDTSNSEWSLALTKLNEEIILAQSHGDFERIIMGGDLNFRDLKWNDEGNVIYGNGLTGQMGEFAKFLSSNFLKNVIDKPTRGENILDLVLTDIELNDRFSDHSLVKVNMTYCVDKVIDTSENMVYTTKIPWYNWRKGDELE